MRRAPRIAGLALVGLASACGAPGTPLPLGEDIRAFILATLEASGPVLEAYEVEDPRARALELSDSARSNIYALAYEDALDELGLPAGPLLLEEDGGPVPTPDRIFELDLDGSQAPIQRPELPTSIASVRLAATNQCADFVATETWTVPDSSNLVGAFMVTLDQARVVAGLMDGRIFMVSAAGMEELASPLEGRPLAGGVVDADGELWLVDMLGNVVHGHPDRGFSAGPWLPKAPEEHLRFASSPVGREVELYVATSSLAVFVLDGDDWRMLRARSGPEADRTRPRPGWLEPGRVGLLGVELDVIVELDVDTSSRAIRLTIPTRPTEDALFEIGFVDGLGAMLATRYSTLFVRDQGGWELFSPPTITPIGYVILDLSELGFLVGGEDGIVAQWVAARGQCPGFAIESAKGNLRWAAAIDGGFATMADRTGDAIIIERYATSRSKAR